MEKEDAVAGHRPVMLKEVLEFLSPGPGKAFLDLTLGGGGHAEALLKRLGSSGQLIGVDRDEEVLLATATRLRERFNNVRFFSANFGDLDDLSEALEGEAFDGVLLDLGVSSIQLDDGKRGFSFQADGPLDMRMDRSSGRTAEELLKKLSQGELASILKEYGQERRAASIARAIVKRRARKPLMWTSELARICEHAAGGKWQRIHPATRTFQALRIAVNDELGALARAMTTMPTMLKRDGRVVVLSFQSLEDGIVKRAFREHARVGVYEVLTAKPLRASAEEVRGNPRARSACLRAARRTDKSGPDVRKAGRT